MKSQFLENANNFFEKHLLEPLQITLAVGLISFGVIKGASSLHCLGYDNLEQTRKKKATIENNFKATNSSMLKSAQHEAGMAGCAPQ